MLILWSFIIKVCVYTNYKHSAKHGILKKANITNKQIAH